MMAIIGGGPAGSIAALEAIKNDEEKYVNILESFNQIESAIKEAQKNFFKKDKKKMKKMKIENNNSN